MADWRTYDDAAADYARVWEPLTAGAAHDLIELAGPTGSERLLDVGTGAGVVLEEAGKATNGSGLAVGVDRSVPMVEAARRARPPAGVAAGHGTGPPLRHARVE